MCSNSTQTTRNCKFSILKTRIKRTESLSRDLLADPFSLEMRWQFRPRLSFRRQCPDARGRKRARRRRVVYTPTWKIGIAEKTIHLFDGTCVPRSVRGMRESTRPHQTRPRETRRFRATSIRRRRCAMDGMGTYNKQTAESESLAQ